jgi:hypothetical protein
MLGLQAKKGLGDVHLKNHIPPAAKAALMLRQLRRG